MNPQERARHAKGLIEDEVFQEALDATQGWAMSKFNQASTPDEAWQARMLTSTVQEFASYMLAVIQMGKLDVDELMKKRDKMSDRKRERESLEIYLTKARKARQDFAESQKGVA